MKFHPAAQILAWCLLVVTMQMLSLGMLLISAGLTLLCAFVVSRHKFIQLLRRTRWIMLSLLLIYAYSTPGHPMFDSVGMFSPIREGLLDGVQQLTRLLAALAALAILLDRLHRQLLIAGLYVLFAPLQCLGVSRERLAVRLALTLQYADVAMLRDTHNWQDTLQSLLAPYCEADGAKQIELPVFRIKASDVLLLGSASLLLFMAIR